jgi:hypothetical protein
VKVAVAVRYSVRLFVRQRIISTSLLDGCFSLNASKWIEFDVDDYRP